LRAQGFGFGVDLGILPRAHLLREGARDAHRHVELVHVAKRLEDGVVLIAPLHVVQARAAVVSRLGVYLQGVGPRDSRSGSRVHGAGVHGAGLVFRVGSPGRRVWGVKVWGGGWRALGLRGLGFRA